MGERGKQAPPVDLRGQPDAERCAPQVNTARSGPRGFVRGSPLSRYAIMAYANQAYTRPKTSLGSSRSATAFTAA